MAKRLSTLSTRLILIVVLGHSVLLPLVFRGVLFIVEQSHQEMFIDQARAFSRFLADNFIENGELVARDRAIELLESATLASNCVFAELWEHGKALYGPNLGAPDAGSYYEDFAFDQNQDGIYYLSVPVLVLGRDIRLRIGFDEQPTLGQIQLAYQRAVIFFSLYVLISVILMIWLSMRLTRPLRALQYASREVASGHFDRHLYTDSKILEIHEMAKDLEKMRRALVGTTQHLQAAIEQRQELERKRILLEKQLLQAQKLEMIGTLAGGMAHEFNNILAPIILYTELAIDALPADSKTCDQLTRVLRSANRAKDLVSQILTFSRRPSSKRNNPVEIQAVIVDTLTMFRAILPATIEIVTKLEGPLWVYGDEAQIQQLIVNLGNNSAKAIKPDTGKITLSLSHAVDPDAIESGAEKAVVDYAKLSVSDTGRGMEPELLERIFEPFFTTAEVGQGSGLGLAVVHGIVTSHGGEIKVSSCVGSGTTVDIFLPLCNSEMTAG